jgi:hypothetical protein
MDRPLIAIRFLVKGRRIIIRHGYVSDVEVAAMGRYLGGMGYRVILPGPAAYVDILKVRVFDRDSEPAQDSRIAEEHVPHLG